MQTPPYTPAKGQQGRSEGPKRPRLVRTLSNTSEDGAVFMGHSPRPEAPKRARVSSTVSNVSEDGAPFLGHPTPRSLTPRPNSRRAEQNIQVQQSLHTFGEDTAPKSPIEKAVEWLEGSWTDKEQKEFLRELVRFLVIVLAFVMLKNLTYECPQDSSRADVGEQAWGADIVDPASIPLPRSPAVVNNGDAGKPVWAPEAEAVLGASDPSAWTPAPQSPAIEVPGTSNINTAIPRPGVPASAIWTFTPAALSSIWQYLQILPKVKSAATGLSWTTDTVSSAMAREPDIHGWQVVVANEKNRGRTLSILRDMEEVSSHLHVEFSSQLFQNSASRNSSEQTSAIESLESLQTQLQELEQHQSEIVRKLGIYHRAGTLASSSLDDYIIKHSKTSAQDLDSFRASMVSNGRELLSHLDALDQNIAFVSQASEGLPWKAQSRGLLGRWVDKYRYRSTVAAFAGLEHLRVYGNTVRGMVTGDMQALGQISILRG